LPGRFKIIGAHGAQGDAVRVFAGEGHEKRKVVPFSLREKVPEGRMRGRRSH